MARKVLNILHYLYWFFQKIWLDKEKDKYIKEWYTIKLFKESITSLFHVEEKVLNQT